MPQTGKPPVEQSCQESSTESNDQPDDQPEAQHGAQPISVAQPFAQPDAQPTDEPNDCCADKSKHETIACRTANALIGDDTVAILNGFTRYSLKESKQQPDAQPDEYHQTQSGLQMLLREKAPSKTPPRPDEFVGEGDTDRLPNQQYAEES